MRFMLDEKSNYITIWLSNGEQPPELDSICQQYNKASYKVAIFRSGNANIRDCVSGLLARSKK